mgnify:CR=1 FL=1
MGLGNARPDTAAGNRCSEHFDRFGAVVVNGVSKCWECYLPPAIFNKRFPKDFYDTKPKEAGK